MSALTKPQQRILDHVNEHGPTTYNGRALKPIERLEELKHVSVKWDMRAHAKGNGIDLSWRITVSPAEDGGS